MHQPIGLRAYRHTAFAVALDGLRLFPRDKHVADQACLALSNVHNDLMCDPLEGDRSVELTRDHRAPLPTSTIGRAGDTMTIELQVAVQSVLSVLRIHAWNVAADKTFEHACRLLANLVTDPAWLLERPALTELTAALPIVQGMLVHLKRASAQKQAIFALLALCGGEDADSKNRRKRIYEQGAAIHAVHMACEAHPSDEPLLLAANTLFGALCSESSTPYLTFSYFSRAPKATAILPKFATLVPPSTYTTQPRVKRVHVDESTSPDLSSSAPSKRLATTCAAEAGAVSPDIAMRTAPYW